MENVKKRSKKKIPKWLAPALLLFSAFLCVAIILIMQNVQRARLPEINEETSVKTLYSFSLDDLLTIDVTPPTGDGYSFLYQNNELVLKNDPQYELRTTYTSALTNLAELFEIQDTVLDTAEEALELSGVGLDPPKASAVFTYRDGTVVKILIGSLVPTETQQYYAMFEGDSKLYTVSPDVYEALKNDFSSLHRVNNPVIQSDLIDRITLTGDTAFSAYYTPSGWLMDSPHAYPLDQSKMDSLLAVFDDLRFSTYIGRAEELNLADYGLDRPRYQLTLDFAASTFTVPDEEGETHVYQIPESTVTIALGNDKTDMLMYALYDGDVMTATNLTFGFAKQLTLDELYIKNPVSFAANNLSYVSFTADGSRQEYQVKLIEKLQQNGDFETDEYGEILYYVSAQKNGSAVNETDFLRWYGSLMNIKSAGRLSEGYAPKGDPLAEIEIKNGDGSLSRTIAFYPYTPVYHAISVDGVFLYYVRSNWQEELSAQP